MKDQINPSFDVEIGQSKNNLIKCKYSGGFSINNDMIKFTPEFGGITDGKSNDFGIHFKSSMYCIDFDLFYSVNQNKSLLEGECKINSLLQKDIPLGMGLKFESESSSYCDNNKVKRENNMWVFTEIGYKTSRENEIGFRFDTMLIGNIFERKNVCIREKTNHGIGYSIYIKNSSNNKNIKLSGKIGKIDRIDCLGDIETINLNNLKLVFN